MKYGGGEIIVSKNDLCTNVAETLNFNWTSSELLELRRNSDVSFVSPVQNFLLKVIQIYFNE